LSAQLRGIQALAQSSIQTIIWGAKLHFFSELDIKKIPLVCFSNRLFEDIHFNHFGDIDG
jgi:hypothetical protein